MNLDVNGIGTQELGFGVNCESQENNSVWLKVTTINTGTLGFIVKPSVADINEDYDFFVFGPNVSCNNIGTAIRCSTTNPIQAGLTSNFTGMNGTETDTSEGRGPDGNSFVKWLDVQAGETYYIVIDRPEGRSAFWLEWTGTARFAEPPINNANISGTPLNLESCDINAPFDDGFTAFDLESNTSAILGTQTDVTITYHETESDANIGINPITSPYTNIANPQIIHTRMTNNITECFDLAQFNLRVNLGPDFAEPSDYVICDDLNDGDDANGRAEFTLSSKNEEILNGQNPSDINITYHSSLTGAELGTAATILPDTYYNSIAFSEEIYVRIQDASNLNCVSTSPILLVVNPASTRIDHSILQCDEDGIIDGITIFNLNEANSILTNGVDNLSTKFYSDAGRTNEITTSNSYTNTSNPQTVYVEVINDNTSCVTEAELTISVSVTDAFDTSMIACDDDGVEDGFYGFNLNDADSDIISGLPSGLDISYFESYEDALTEQNSLSTAYTNTTPNLQTIYARVENNNNCYGISEVQLIVNELPDIENETLVNYCLNFFPQPMLIDAGLNSGNTADFLYSWSTGEDDYTIESNTIGNITVTVTNRTTNCSKEKLITIEASNTATIESIEVTDASENNSVVVNATGEGEYEYSLVNNEGVNYDFQKINTFEDVAPGFYTVLIRDIENNCGTTQQDISVIGFPKFFTPNSDGENDTWQVYGISDTFQSQTKILIYNRYGKLLKELSPSEEGWNGFFNGQVLPTDDYWFSVLLEDGRIFKDHFTLKH
ncbi:T9SS type B sorting domain-containing protein [Hyunsoonleella flava]|uniref:T9SS type B sorting domain-containing protein n=2 Tax=Hyunsoonleella flava TaxID=2527939 RepID=A0A4V2JAI6_9FLAO|nr:T9SS type B sorting domain-containing protein [Hyunsoonleella flava]